MVTQEQSEKLKRPLDPKRIKQRTQSGTQLSYIEGWDAIAKANEIFGYGEWSYTIVDLIHIGTEPRHDKYKNRDGWQVAYRATVKVTAIGVEYEDVGFGDSVDYTSPLSGHEGASKEAVTDALKRALKNFGDQFGLTLYDKEQKGVANGSTDEISRPEARTNANQLDAKRKAYFANAQKLGVDGENAKALVKSMFDLDSFNNASLEQLRAAYERLRDEAKVQL